MQHQVIKYSDEGLDKYQRTLAYCFMNGESINSLIVETKNEVTYDHHRPMFYSRELEAKYYYKDI